MWADNQWGAIVLRGAPDAAGNMEFVTVIPSRQRDVKLLYEKHADGTLRIGAMVRNADLAGAGADPLSLKLRGAAKDGQHQPTVRAGHVRPPYGPPGFT